MAFKEGRKKTGGRKPGVPNRLTAELQGLLKEVLHSELENLPHLLEKLPDNERIAAITKLLPYVVPRVQAVGIYTGESRAARVFFERLSDDQQHGRVLDTYLYDPEPVSLETLCL